MCVRGKLESSCRFFSLRGAFTAEGGRHGWGHLCNHQARDVQPTMWCPSSLAKLLHDSSNCGWLVYS